MISERLIILALAVRHRTERPAIRMEGGERPMKRLPAAVCFAEDFIVMN